MSHAFTLQVCKITTPEKLPDRFLTSGVLYQNTSTSLSDQVVLAYVFEVTKPWFPSSHVLPTLEEVVRAGHAQLKPGTTLVDQFEGLLRTLNERLNSLSETGETDWIGNLNGIILVLSQDELHFSQTGHCPAYLLQKNRIRQITDDLPQEGDPHPLKTFANLASGTLQEQDYILTSNLELYNEISLDALRRIINNSSPYQSCQAIARELKKEKNPAVAPLIFKIIPKTESEKNPSSEPIEINLEDELQSPLRKFQKRLQPLFVKIGGHLKRGGNAAATLSKQAYTKAQETMVPKATELLQKGSAQVKELQKKVQKTSPSEDTITDAPPVVELILPESATPAAVEEAPISAPATVIPASELALDSSNAIPLALTETKERPKLPNPLNFVKNKLQTPRSRKIAALAGAIVLVIATGVIVNNKRHPQVVASTTNQTNSQIQQITTLDKKTATAIELNQSIEAAHEVQQAQQLLLAVKDETSSQKSQIDQLWISVNAHADSLTHTTRLANPTQYTFTSPVSAFTTALPYFYGANGNTLLRTGIGTAAQTQKSITLPDSSDTLLSLVSSSESDTAAYAFSKKNNIYRISQSDSTTTITTIAQPPGGFATGDVLSTYFGNLYILDGKTGLLWKYATDGSGGYGKGISVIDINSYNIKDSISLAIDGSIYILKQDGSITRFTSGKQDSDFTVKNIPLLYQQAVQPLQIITTQDMSNVYMLDGGVTSSDHSTARVLSLNKDGGYTQAYAFPSTFNRISAFDINEQQKKLWVINNGQLFEFGL